MYIYNITIQYSNNIVQKDDRIYSIMNLLLIQLIKIQVEVVQLIYYILHHLQNEGMCIIKQNMLLMTIM